MSFTTSSADKDLKAAKSQTNSNAEFLQLGRNTAQFFWNHRDNNKQS